MCQQTSPYCPHPAHKLVELNLGHSLSHRKLSMLYEQHSNSMDEDGAVLLQVEVSQPLQVHLMWRTLSIRTLPFGPFI
ncbi:hypothetical protein PILCRDRAFT_825850 [Piloderma croceum F 1598]|uniref:Uncharacterized protein n=1 Tax=Piloderma croceum (strain F 1598) TaxID=765440 RepID=A0A0C3ASF9_PILCF|nr:hypothetical protein PILCRDRAFT_825850 [Piloderma croceum F 1598]